MQLAAAALPNAPTVYWGQGQQLMAYNVATATVRYLQGSDASAAPVRLVCDLLSVQRGTGNRPVDTATIAITYSESWGDADRLRVMDKLDVAWAMFGQLQANLQRLRPSGGGAIRVLSASDTLPLLGGDAAVFEYGTTWQVAYPRPAPIDPACC
jgi:hypothetical protein